MTTNMVRMGKVSNTNPASATVDVVFPDIDDMVSTNLPILFPQGLKNKAYAMPDIGENVLCVFLEQDGFCLGCFYTESEIPPVKIQDKVHYAFEDGTFIEYDRKEHLLKADIKGDADIKVKNIVVEAENINATAQNINLKCATLTVDATGDILLKGNTVTLQGKTEIQVVD